MTITKSTTNNAFTHNMPASLMLILLFDMAFCVIKTTLNSQNKNNAPMNVLKAITPSILNTPSLAV